MRTYVLLALFLFCATSLVQAQREETVLGNRGLGLSGYWINWHHQLANYNDENAYKTNWMIGLEFGKSLYLGYGVYKMNDNVPFGDGGSPDRFDMHFNAFRVGYAYQAHRAVHPVLNVDLGTAKGNINNEDFDKYFIVQPALGIELNVFRWIRLSLEGGYRFASDVDLMGVSDRDLSGAFGQATIRFGYSWGRPYKKRSYDGDWE
jgi:hypothetical protein